ncbi:MAG: lipopolysaccharide biosynthesis protein [Pseudomonadota bacterium]
MKATLTKLLPKSVFARGVSVLVGGTASAQALMVLAAPLLTRLYTPEDFGILAVFTALLTFLTVVASGRYELAIPLPEKDQDAANITLLALLIVFASTIITAVVFLVWPRAISATLNVPELAHYLWLIPMGVFFIGSYQVFHKHAVRQQQFPTLAKTRIYQALGTLGIQLGGYSLGPLALIGGQAAGQGIGASGLAISALKRPEFKRCQWKEVRKQAVRYKDFPIYSTWTSVFNTASLQLAPVMFVSLYGAGVAGLYALTLRILSMPANLIGNAVGSVFLSEAPESKRNGNLADLVSKLHSRLAMAGSLPMVVILFFGPDLFALIFGAEWRRAGVYAQWMAPWLYLQFQWSPLSMLTGVLELQGQALVSQILTFGLRFGTFFLIWNMSLGENDAVLAFAIVSAVTYFCRMIWFVNKAGVGFLSLMAKELYFVSISFLLVTPVYLYSIGTISI